MYIYVLVVNYQRKKIEKNYLKLSNGKKLSMLRFSWVGTRIRVAGSTVADKRKRVLYLADLPHHV